MKYIDAEKLKAEIERLKARAEHYSEITLTGGEKEYWSGESGVLELLTSFIDSLQQEQEQPDVDLDALVDEAFDKYSSVDGYGQLSVSFNRAELYSFIKKITRKEEETLTTPIPNLEEIVSELVKNYQA